jgi:hypothetical protein
VDNGSSQWQPCGRPNVLVNLLRTQGQTVTPYIVLATVNGFLESSGQPPSHKWEYIWHWCMVKGQAGPSGKSRVFNIGCHHPSSGLAHPLKMLATTIGTNMLQFSQAIAPQAAVGGNSGAKMELATRKGSDQNQIAKLRNACGVHNAQQIPLI